MWIPKWLGEIYAKLYVQFNLELFTFQQARKALSIDERRLLVAFSKLHAKRVLTVFKRSSPRLYRLIDPECFILIASETIKNLDRIPQERYLNLICKCFKEVYKTFKLESFAIYGSVARGAARENSDVDILLISNSFQGTIASRIDELCKLEVAFRDELNWLSDHGVNTRLSYLPLRKEEAEKTPLLFLDLTEDAILLFDRNSFLESLLLKFKAKLVEKGAKRVFIDGEKWYWDLKPDYKFGDIVEIN